MMAVVSEWQWDPDTYLAEMAAEIPGYEELQEAVTAATAGIRATRVLELGTGTGETALRVRAIHPETSWVGIGLAAFTAVTMPLCARAKRRVGHQLGSSATVKEASQTTLCAYLSVALLVGLLLNAVADLWWADPAAALVISFVAVKEGRESWRGEGCDCC